MKIKAYENSNRLAISLYPSSEQRTLIKHTNSMRTSSKLQPSQLDHLSTSTRYYDQQTSRSDRFNSNVTLLLFPSSRLV